MADNTKGAFKSDKEKLKALGVQYAVGAAHWRVEVADEMAKESVEAQIIDWHHQQMYLACDDRVTILGHPWACNDTWFEDFSIVPASMHDELAAALIENGKYAECNVGMFIAEDTSKGNFRYQYAEFLRFLFERGIPLTYGSDCHGHGVGIYPDDRYRAQPRGNRGRHALLRRVAGGSQGVHQGIPEIIQKGSHAEPF